MLAEDVVPRETLWDETIVSSRLLEYEIWVRLNARNLVASHGELARQLLQRVAFLELAPQVLSRALEPFPVRVRTLDALHLASMDFLRRQNQQVELATYDARLRATAARLGFSIFEL